MPTVKVLKSTSLSPKESYEKITKLLKDDQELKKLDPGYQCDFDPDNLRGDAKGKQFKADMTVSSEGEGSKVELSVDLPFHLGLVKGVIQKTLQKKVDEALPS